MREKLTEMKKTEILLYCMIIVKQNKQGHPTTTSSSKTLFRLFKVVFFIALEIYSKQCHKTFICLVILGDFESFQNQSRASVLYLHKF